MGALRFTSAIFLIAGVVLGIFATRLFTSPTEASQGTGPVYEYAYGWGELDTEGAAITLHVPELETVDSEWGKIEAYKEIDFSIGFEGGAEGTEMHAINKIAAMGWELVCKYYVDEGYEKGHHYWFRREKV